MANKNENKINKMITDIMHMVKEDDGGKDGLIILRKTEGNIRYSSYASAGDAIYMVSKMLVQLSNQTHVSSEILMDDLTCCVDYLVSKTTPDCSQCAHFMTMPEYEPCCSCKGINGSSFYSNFSPIDGDSNE